MAKRAAESLPGRSRDRAFARLVLVGEGEHPQRGSLAGRSGTGAVDDSRRLSEFIYRNLGTITEIIPSLDTHHAMQVFHSVWLVDGDGNHPTPYTLVSAEDVAAGRWKMNPAVAAALGLEAEYAQRHLEHCTSPVVVPGLVDYTDEANAAFERYERAGMHVVRSTDPIAAWPGR